MTPQDLEHVNTLNGYKLWAVMKWAERNKKDDVYNACYLRAKELTLNKFGSWEEAKSVFNTMVFPTWKRNESRSQTTRVLGYPCEIGIEVDNTMEIKSQYMALMNPHKNVAVVKYLVSSGDSVKTVRKIFG